MERTKSMAKRTPVHMMQKALDDPEIPKLYANTFECALGTGDVALLLRNAHKTVGVVSLSYTVAKTLSLRLQELITFLETKSGNKIMTSGDIEKALRPKNVKDPTLQ
jgi:hypothetical protein